MPDAPAPDQPSDAEYCGDGRRLQLRSTPDAPMKPEAFPQVAGLLDAVPYALDPFGTYAHFDHGHVMAGGAGTDALPETPIFTPPPLAAVTDLALGYDGVLYLAVDGELILCDRHNRWPNFTLPGSGTAFTVWRLAAHPAGGVVALDRENHQLLRVQGLPLPDLPPIPYAAGVMHPCDDNPDPPRVSAVLSLPADEEYVAIAGDADGTVAVLSWHRNDADNDFVRLRTLTSLAVVDAAWLLDGPRFPYAMAWLEHRQIALLASGNKKAFVYGTALGDATLKPTGATYVLADVNAGPFAHGFSQPPQYNVGADLLPLVPLSLNSLARAGSARATTPIDSGAARTPWHRVYLEASLPARCGVIVWLAAADDPAVLDDPSTMWFPHVFGSADGPDAFPDAPRAVWQRVPSEVPFHRGLLGETERDRKGLFMALVQRANRAVRTLRGRYLGVRIDLSGDGRTTPEIAALRVYGPRFSYVERYLPELYRESLFGPDADVTGSSTGADMFERFVNLFEAPMTQLEDRIASAHLLTNPASAPEEALDWLGSWIGVEPDPLPPARRRARIARTPALYRERGTVQGIADALDVATGGLCQRGAVILLEDYRLRHTFATILGADLSITDDPLLPGSWASANSFVGDTLFLGDEHRAEFLSLFGDAIESAREQAQVDAFFENLAHRLTVFIHDRVETVDRQTVQRVVEREKPAHVAVSFLRASQPFLIGMASLLGVNTYLAPAPPRELARVDVSGIGGHAFIGHVACLDPRLEDARAGESFTSPIARLGAPPVVPIGAPIVLDGSGSTAAAGRRLTNFHWTIVSGPH
jgi:phage tail-like protein